MLTRRGFLKAVTALPFLAVVLFAHPAPAKATEPAQPEPQPWQFPLTLPAYFVKERPRQPDRTTRKVYLPLGV